MMEIEQILYSVKVVKYYIFHNLLTPKLQLVIKFEVFKCSDFIDT